MPAEDKVVVNGEEVVPAKKVKLFRLKSHREIKTLIQNKRLEQKNAQSSSS